MEISLKWIIFGILLFEVPIISCFYTEYVIEDSCKHGDETIVFNTSKLGTVGVLIPTNRLPYATNKNCTIIIQPPNGLGVVVSVQKIDFRQPEFFCVDYLKIYHADALFSPTTLCRFKFDLKEKTSYSSRGKMEILYHVESTPSDGLGDEKGFLLTFTIVSDDLQDCLKDDMFMCNNGKCIPDSLTCDFKNNCGDNSDEDKLLCNSPLDPFIRVTDIIYGILLCILIIIMVSSCVVIISRRRRRNIDTDSISDTDEPTARLAPYQTVHPSGFFICQNPAGPTTPYFQHSKVIHSEGGFSNPCYPSDFPQPPPPYSQ